MASHRPPTELDQMGLLLALIIAAATAGLAVREAEPKRLASSGFEDHYEQDPAVFIDADSSPILAVTTIEQVSPGLPRRAFARLVGGIAISGVVIGGVILVAAKAIGLLLKHFASGS